MSFKEEVALEAIKVLVIGLIATFIVGWYQYRSEQNQRLNQEAIAAAKVRTDILVEQRKQLTSAMEEYFKVVEDSYVTGRAREKASDLQSLQRNIRVSIYAAGLAAALSPESDKEESRFEKVAQGFCDSIDKMNSILIEGELTGAAIMEEGKQLRKAYQSLLVALAEESIGAVRQDFAQVHDYGRR